METRISQKSLEWMKKYIGFLCITLIAIYPGISSAASTNIVTNPGFESGNSPWIFYTDGEGTFLNNAPGIGSTYAGHIAISSPGTNVQLYQGGLVLDPNTQYSLSFKAYSNTGHDLSFSMMKHGSPYTNYGLSNYVVNLGTSWSEYSVQFTTSGFSTTVGDGRLMFWLGPYDAAADQYYFDDVMFTKVSQNTQNTGITTLFGKKWKMTFNDDFTGSSLDTTKWNGGYANLQWCDNGACPQQFTGSSVSNGTLKLQGTIVDIKAGSNAPNTRGMINLTIDHFGNYVFEF